MKLSCHVKQENRADETLNCSNPSPKQPRQVYTKCHQLYTLDFPTQKSTARTLLTNTHSTHTPH
jgi:hypothetical protein